MHVWGNVVSVWSIFSTIVFSHTLQYAHIFCGCKFWEDTNDLKKGGSWPICVVWWQTWYWIVTIKCLHTLVTSNFYFVGHNVRVLLLLRSLLNCISRNFCRKIFLWIWLRQTFREFYFCDYPKGVANLHRVDQWVSLPLSPNNHHRAHFEHEKFIRNGTEAHFFQLTSQEYTCITSLNKWIFSQKRYLLGYLSPLHVEIVIMIS